MDLSKKIKILLAYNNESISGMARRLGVTPQALSQRLMTGKFSTEEIEQIAEILGCKYYYGFELSDGTRI